MNFRDAKVKHARLAIAAAEWPPSEMWDKFLAKIIGLPSLVDGAGRVPSLLNGGLGKIPFAYWFGVLSVWSVIDVYG